MKQIITVLLVLGWLQGVGQSAPGVNPMYKTYVSLSTGANSNREPGFSLEMGRWGMVSPISFSWDVDLNYSRSFTNPDVWTGPKLYYTIYQTDRFSYMLYGSPKFNLGKNRTNDFLIENGLSLNYVLNPEALISFTQYWQSSTTYTFQPNLALSITKLF